MGDYITSRLTRKRKNLHFLCSCVEKKVNQEDFMQWKKIFAYLLTWEAMFYIQFLLCSPNVIVIIGAQIYAAIRLLVIKNELSEENFQNFKSFFGTQLGCEMNLEYSPFNFKNLRNQFVMWTLVMLPLEICWMWLMYLNIRCMISRFQLGYMLRTQKLTFALLMSLIL